MDRQMILEHLTLSRQHVAVGEKNIARQRELIEELDKDGHDTIDARSLLLQFQETQAEHVKHCDRLEKELASAS